jgi:hypothetical protein
MKTSRSIASVYIAFLVFGLLLGLSRSTLAQSWPPTPPSYESGNRFLVNGHYYDVHWYSTTGSGTVEYLVAAPGGNLWGWINGTLLKQSRGGGTVNFDNPTPSTNVGDANGLRRYIQAETQQVLAGGTCQAWAYIPPVTFVYSVTAEAPYDPNVSQVSLTFEYGGAGYAAASTGGNDNTAGSSGSTICAGFSQYSLLASLAEPSPANSSITNGTKTVSDGGQSVTVSCTLNPGHGGMASVVTPATTQAGLQVTLWADTIGLDSSGQNADCDAFVRLELALTGVTVQ